KHLYLERQPTALRPSTNFIINKYPHLSVVLIFKEQCRRSNERGALYRPHSLGQGKFEIFFLPSAASLFEARRAFYRPFTFGQEENLTSFSSLLLASLVEARGAFYRPFSIGQGGNENSVSPLPASPLKRRRAFYRSQNCGQEGIANYLVSP
ncbi:MAG TPA: hypothetical protein VK938_11185, partial [Methylophilaceae bacterium]|nr:hypothetical protein [Methylophilaceae bacterium]